ncbi:44201_t:CDS:2, partial [Gigaspora margarita]
IKVAAKKSSKKDSSKKSNRGKASLEETRGSELTQSFLERFENLRIGGSNTYENSNTFESKIIENQGEILHQLQELNFKIRRLENQFKDMEKKMNNNFNFTNEKYSK